MEAYYCPQAVDAHVTAIVLLLQPVCNELLHNTESQFRQLFGFFFFLALFMFSPCVENS